MFSALIVSETDEGCRPEVRDAADAELPDGDVTVDVEYSTVNYKDALAIVNGKPVLRTFPIAPGIDAAGTVAESSSADWSVGDAVVMSGWGVGEERWGGLGQRTRVDGSWLTPVPEGWTTRDTMIVGTAGVTAALAVGAIERTVAAPGPVLVTGASGGVGTFSIMLLAARGYDVLAGTTTPDASAYLEGLGATELVDSRELGADIRPLAKPRWAGAIDNVGGPVLAGVISSTNADGTIVACGNAGGMDLPTWVAPFILRAVCLQGLQAVRVPAAARREAWGMLADRVPRARLDAIAEEVGLAGAIETATRILANQVTGRVVVNVRA
ncbi:MAG: acryloyl-CoA reductase [Acidimicrobiia bacterium]